MQPCEDSLMRRQKKSQKEKIFWLPEKHNMRQEKPGLHKDKPILTRDLQPLVRRSRRHLHPYRIKVSPQRHWKMQRHSLRWRGIQPIQSMRFSPHRQSLNRQRPSWIKNKLNLGKREKNLMLALRVLMRRKSSLPRAREIIRLLLQPLMSSLPLHSKNLTRRLSS